MNATLTNNTTRLLDYFVLNTQIVFLIERYVIYVTNRVFLHIKSFIILLAL